MAVAPSKAHMSPRISPHPGLQVPILAGTSTLPANTWRDVLVVDDFGGESNSAWDVQFSGEEVVSQYTTAFRNLGFEQSLEAVRTCSLWEASIATETSKALKEEHSRYLSSVTELRNSLSQAEADIGTRDESINILKTSLKNNRDEHSKLESDMLSLYLSCGEKDALIKEKNKRIQDLEYSALDEYDCGFLQAIQQVEVLHPGLDLSGTNSRLIVRGSRIVDPTKSSFGVVTGP
ncbi:hypothetical protein L195_g001186 [Trifolium pratense]|uniref:Uncharacterized protein n=1 Tax=Trifolium pratense TaxID=57577 RepID=A0A2K3NP03_TRIPR|nr:hypothetical protein L195_g001186 [Trifolium pratense]